MVNLKTMSFEELNVAIVTQELEAIIADFSPLGLGLAENWFDWAKTSSKRKNWPSRKDISKTFEALQTLPLDDDIIYHITAALSVFTENSQSILRSPSVLLVVSCISYSKLLLKDCPSDGTRRLVLFAAAALLTVAHNNLKGHEREFLYRLFQLLRSDKGPQFRRFFKTLYDDAFFDNQEDQLAIALQDEGGHLAYLIKALKHDKKGPFCQLLKAICDDEEGRLDQWFEAVNCHAKVYLRHLLNSLRDLQAVWASKNGRGSSLLSTHLHLTLLTLQDMWRIPFLEPWVTPLGNFQRVCDQDQHWMGCFQDDCQFHLGAKLSVGIFPRWYFDYESREAFLNFFWTGGHKCSYLDIAFGQHRSWRVYQDETIKNGKPYMVDLEATFECRQSDWSVVEIRQTSSFDGNTVIVRACRTSLRPALPSETAMIVVHGVGWCPMYSPDFDELWKDQFVQVKSGERMSGYELRGAYPSKPTQKFTNRNQAQALKNEGNSFYKNGRLDRALMAYETALAVIESCPRSNPVITLKVQILSNLTQVVLQIGSREYSFHNNLLEEISKESTDAAIASQLLVKSLYRCARAFALLDNNSEQALTCLQRCESYDRNNVDVQRLRNELENERRVIAYICVLWLLFLTHRGSLESTA